jgi:hypothetical protein
MRATKGKPAKVYKLLTEAYSKVMEAKDMTVVFPTSPDNGKPIHRLISEAMASLSLAIDQTGKIT